MAEKKSVGSPPSLMGQVCTTDPILRHRRKIMKPEIVLGPKANPKQWLILPIIVLVAIQAVLKELLDSIKLRISYLVARGWKRTLKHLLECQFHKVMNRKEYGFFFLFLSKQALPAKGFLVEFNAGGSNILIFYEVTLAAETINIKRKGKPYYNEYPEELRGYPLWRMAK